MKKVILYMVIEDKVVAVLYSDNKNVYIAGFGSLIEQVSDFPIETETIAFIVGMLNDFDYEQIFTEKYSNFSFPVLDNKTIQSKIEQRKNFHQNFCRQSLENIPEIVERYKKELCLQLDTGQILFEDECLFVPINDFNKDYGHLEIKQI